MLIVIRHGQSQWNVEPKRCQGQLDVELSDEGRAAARAIAATLPRFVAAYSSHLSRARETAELLLSTQPSPPTIVQEPRLAEAHCGSWEGLLLEDVKGRWPTEWSALATDDPSFRFPEGESLLEVRERFSEAIRELDLRHLTETALVVAHGGPMRLFLKEHEVVNSTKPGSPPLNLEGFRIVHASSPAMTQLSYFFATNL